MAALSFHLQETGPPTGKLACRPNLAGGVKPLLSTVVLSFGCII